MTATRRLAKWLTALTLCGLLPAVACATDADEAAWQALQSGKYVLLMRHEATEAGIGDPPDFRKDDCRTQRNLSAAGRASARRTGERFRQRGIPIADVWSSRWCRCIDTARLAFGTAKPVAMLDSMFNDTEGSDQKKLQELQTALRSPAAGGNRVLVTHAVNIRQLTGVSVASGEIIVASVDPAGRLSLVARLAPR